MTHSLPSCPGTKEVTSPTARQEKPLDYSPAREPSARLLVLPDCAGGGAEAAEVAVGQARSGTPPAPRLRVQTVGTRRGTAGACAASGAPAPNHRGRQGQDWLGGWSRGRATLTWSCVTLSSVMYNLV